MKEQWFYYYDQAKAEGCNDADAARMADFNTADHYADTDDNYSDEQKERKQ